MFLNNNKDLEESDIARLINVLCMQKDMYYICKTCKIITINGNNLSNLIDIVIEVKNVSYIKELLTTMQNINYSINKICFLKDPYLIYEILSYSSSFIGNENVNKMINKLCEIKEYRYMVKAGSIEKLSSQNVIKLVDTLIASGKVLELVEFANVCKILPESKFDEIINIERRQNMQVILKEDVVNLGYKDDIVTVKDGYGRNFLIPMGKAVIASESAKKVLAENLKQRAHKLAKIKADAEELAAKLQGVSLTIGAKTSSTGTIFCSVTNIQVAEALAKAGFEIDRKIISIKESVKEVGQYKATLKLHKEVSVDIPFEVVSE